MSIQIFPCTKVSKLIYCSSLILAKLLLSPNYGNKTNMQKYMKVKYFNPPKSNNVKIFLWNLKERCLISYFH